MAHTSDALQNFNPGALRKRAGHFRTGQSATGAWWLIDPDDQPFFLRAVNEVPPPADGERDPVLRLRAWGFNALGAGASPILFDEGLPFVATVDFCAAGACIRHGGARLPDVFDPQWPQAAMARAAETCPPLANRRELIGWVADDGLGWAQPTGGGQPALLQICLSLEPSFAAFHAAWEFVLALHGGRLETLARAWGQPAIANRGVVREFTRSEQGFTSRGYLRDDAQWTQEFARRYFATTAAAIRAHDPNHLVLGARATGPAGAAALAAGAETAIDVTWSAFDDLATRPAKPVIVGDFSWANPKFSSPPRTRPARGLTSVERMLRRGRAAWKRLAVQPGVVGYAWRRWSDAAGEQPPFAGGLVHVNGADAREHTELLADLNARAHDLHLVPPAAVSP
jgi:agarase